MNNKQLIEELEKRDMTQYVGSIQLSDRIIVSDPCYDYSTWCQSVLDNVLAGNYKCFVKSVKTEWDDRIGELIIYNENYSDYPMELISCDIGVDSGQAGFFDYEYFKGIKDQDEEKSCLLYTSDNYHFYEQLHKDIRFIEFFQKYPHVRIFGEFLVPHQIKYYEKDVWKKFYVFDVVTDVEGLPEEMCIRDRCKGL